MIEWYCMCKRNEETIDHLLLHCEAASNFWQPVFSLFGLDWVMLRWVVNILGCWKGWFDSHHSATLVENVPSNRLDHFPTAAGVYHSFQISNWKQNKDRHFDDTSHIKKTHIGEDQKNDKCHLHHLSFVNR